MINPIRPRFFIRENNFKLDIFHANKNEGLVKHQHSYNHITICNAGSILVRKQNRELVMTKDTQPVNLVANEWHEIEVLEDNTIFINVFIDNTEATNQP